MRWGIIALCFWLPLANAGKVYVCKDASGATLYSQTPCPETFQEKEQRSYDHEVSGGSAGASSDDLKRMAEDVSKNNQRIKAERDKRKAEARLEKIKKERDAMINEQTDLASSIAGVNARNRGKAVVDNMMSRIEGYNKQMNVEKDKINHANERLKEANAPSESSARSAEAR
ncbi:MAG: hypothetical protein COA68_15035 [Oceanobacter sp.]|nr:MAG: hypothetical protein COA68_15035 [Oceanobacter sp.]